MEAQVSLCYGLGFRFSGSGFRVYSRQGDGWRMEGQVCFSLFFFLFFFVLGTCGSPGANPACAFSRALLFFLFCFSA